MILIDAPKRHRVPGMMRGRPFTASHLISDIPGDAGTLELKNFAVTLGLKLSWIQRPSSESEHFDVVNGRYSVALELGAKLVDRNELISAIRAKR